MRTSYFMFPLFMAALLLSGCSTPVSESGSSAVSDSGQTEFSEQVTPEITADESAEDEISVSAESSDPADLTFPLGGSVGGLYSMDNDPYPQPTTLSENNVFVDYDYIKDIPSDTGHEKYGYFTDIAVEAVKSSDRYKVVSQWIKDNPAAADMVVMYQSGGENETLGDWLVNGELAVRVRGAFINDFDGDGYEEAFVVVQTILDCDKALDYVIFVNYRGKADPEYKWNRISYLVSVDMLDYGADKQLIFNAYGSFGADTHSPLIGVRRYEMFTHYDFRGSYSKSDCFLTAFGWQGSGEYMIYDTSAHKYRTVVGVPISVEEMYAMDSTGVLPPQENLAIPEAQIIGNKFYALGGSEYWGGVTFYTYENGAFTEVRGENSNEIPIRISEFPSKDTVLIDDYDAVISSMVTPAEALSFVHNEQ